MTPRLLTLRSLGLALVFVAATAISARADGISSYGTPGLIDMPSATATGDGLLT